MWILAMTSILAPGQAIEIAQYESRVECLTAGYIMIRASVEAYQQSAQYDGWIGPGISCKESTDD